ncbi:hypothetical protein NBO_3g0013 [Nosema bombycis CQ1]|uniref:Uncharacterized protein n=1 Tax=Nosema bombycis (strain CQ1 / CVCC 102059) TaxID=578461 RepID=R0KZ46_NOSB1|nr:hypothetical protein NBO_3g0013 [Nosema bombycis CQ1]|eukprot:EOB15462.1 hypothetical protein NBO_3g0013 [Nosema bombycis CQ1]
MNELMKKVFKFGMYGKPITFLTKSEINSLKKYHWIEFLDKNELDELENNIEFVPSKKTDLNDDLYVRMNFTYFKNLISDSRFKEISSFKIFNHLLISGDYVKQADLQHIGQVDTKKVSYVLKILRKSSFIKQKIIKNISYVKLDVDSLFNRNKKQYPLPIIPREYFREVPIYYEIKRKLMNTEVGLTSSDIRRDYGVSVKRAHACLKKLEIEREKEIAIKQVFDGKTRKHLFYKVENSELVDDDLKEKGLITVNDRICALKQLLKDRKWINTCEETFIKFRDILGSKYMPDRKTMISTAIKANLKVFNIRGTHSVSSWLIANNDVQLSDIVQNKIKAAPKDNEFSKKVMSKYVKVPDFIAIDNLYKIKISNRFDIIFNFIYKNSKHECLQLSDEFLMNRSLLFLFNLVPFYKINFVKKLIGELNNLQDDKIQMVDENVYIYDILERYTIKDVLDLPIDTLLKKEINERLKDQRLVRSILEPFRLGLIEIFINTKQVDRINNIVKGKLNSDHIINIKNDDFIEYNPKNKQDLNLILSEIETSDLSIRLHEDYQEFIDKRRTLEKLHSYVSL